MVHHLLRSLLGLVFVATGSVKLWDVTQFASNLGDFGIVLDELVPATAWFISLAEVLVGIGLMANLRGSLAAALMLMTLFIGVVAYGLVLGLDVDCGCFGPAFPVELKTQLLIDFGLVGWSGLVFVSGRRRRQKNAVSHIACEVSVPGGKA